MKGNFSLCQVGHSIIPTPTSDGHMGNVPTNHCTTTKAKDPLTHQDHPLQPTTKNSQGFISTKVPPLVKVLALVRPPMPPCGFAGVTACLRTLELVEVDQDTPASVVTMGMVSNPGMSSICSSWVVRDDEKGLVYLDTVTTSIGRMVIGTTELKEGPTIEDVMDQQ